MTILYIHQYFKTPDQPGGTRSYWMARNLLNAGHRVVMLTSSPEYEGRKNVDGIDVVYLKVPYNQKMSILMRFVSFCSFFVRATIVALKEKNIDLVIATSTPLTVGIPALLVKWFRKIPFVFEVRDLWPEVPIQMGAIKNGFIKGIAVKLEKVIYVNSAHVIALSPGMKEGVERFIPKNKISLIPNMSKKDDFWPRDPDLNLLEKLGLRKESFKVIHFGSLGLANGAESIIETAKLLKGDCNIDFIFIGGGSTEDELKEECIRHDLINVHFLGAFSMEQTSEIVNLCDISIVSFKDIPILYTNSPNKFFDSLSAGKPIIVNSAGWTKDIVENYNCGFYVNPNKPEELRDKILTLRSNPELVAEMGTAARALAESKYDKSILSAKFTAVINYVLGLSPLPIEESSLSPSLKGIPVGTPKVKAVYEDISS